VVRKAGAVNDVCYLRGWGGYVGWKKRAWLKHRGEGAFGTTYRGENGSKLFTCDVF
jgi:hypothetical protein